MIIYRCSDESVMNDLIILACLLSWCSNCFLWKPLKRGREICFQGLLHWVVRVLPASACQNKNQRFRKLCFFRFSCFFGLYGQKKSAIQRTELCHLGEAEVTTSSESYKCSLQKTQVKQKSSEKPPAPQINEAEFCFTFHYFCVGGYPNLHKLVWYSGMTGHVVASKCSIASCIRWPCSSPAPSVRIASDSKHQPCRFLSL